MPPKTEHHSLEVGRDKPFGRDLVLQHYGGKCDNIVLLGQVPRHIRSIAATTSGCPELPPNCFWELGWAAGEQRYEDGCSNLLPVAGQILVIR